MFDKNSTVENVQFQDLEKAQGCPTVKITFLIPIGLTSQTKHRLDALIKTA